MLLDVFGEPRGTQEFGLRLGATRPRAGDALPVGGAEPSHVAKPHSDSPPTVTSPARPAGAATAARRNQGALPARLEDADRQHLHAVAAGVLHDGRGGVETHGPRIEQGAGKGGRIVVLDPGGAPGDEGKTRGVALGESVLAEAADLLEDPLGKLLADALVGHAGDELLTVLLDAAALAPCGHVAAQLVRLSRRVVGRDDRKAHHLLLKQRYAEGLLEHGLQFRVGVLHGFLPGAASEVGVDHTAGDRAGADDAYLDDEIVELARAKSGEHRHLGAALELKDADGVRPGDHLEDRAIGARDARHGKGAADVGANETEGIIEMRQRPEAEEIDLEQTHCLHVPLVPLDDGALLHGGVFHRHDVVNRLASEQKSPGMNGEMAREVENLGYQAPEHMRETALLVDPRLLHGRLEVAVPM